MYLESSFNVQFNLIFSSTAKHLTLVDSLNVVGHVLLETKRHFHRAFMEMPFPKMYCSTVIVPLIP